jgi:hypothetical protein
MMRLVCGITCCRICDSCQLLRPRLWLSQVLMHHRVLPGCAGQLAVVHRAETSVGVC